MDRRRKYDWEVIQDFYERGHVFEDCIREFGFSRGAWHKAKVRGEIRIRERRQPIDVVLATAKNRTHLKLRLLGAGLLESRCSHCGIADWRGKALAAQIDHINGIRNDNRLENLRMLCPNCHSLTATYGKRKKTK